MNIMFLIFEFWDLVEIVYASLVLLSKQHLIIIGWGDKADNWYEPYFKESINQNRLKKLNELK